MRVRKSIRSGRVPVYASRYCSWDGIVRHTVTDGRCRGGLDVRVEGDQ